MTQGIAGLAGHLPLRLRLPGPETGTETPCREHGALPTRVAPGARVCQKAELSLAS